MIAVVVLGVEPRAAEVGRGSDGGAAFAAFNDFNVEVGAGDWVSPPLGIKIARLFCNGRGRNM